MNRDPAVGTLCRVTTSLICPFPERNYWLPFDNKAVLAHLTTSCWTYGTEFPQSKLTQFPNTYMASVSWYIHGKHNCYASSYLYVGWSRNNLLQSMYEIHNLLFEQLYDDSLCYYMINSLRPRPNRRYFADDIFKRIFENENEWISPRISLKFVPKVRINNIPALVQIMDWRRPGDKPLSEPMMVCLLTHICVTRPQWVKIVSNEHILQPTHL